MRHNAVAILQYMGRALSECMPDDAARQIGTLLLQTAKIDTPDDPRVNMEEAWELSRTIDKIMDGMTPQEESHLLTDLLFIGKLMDLYANAVEIKIIANRQNRAREN